MKKLYYFGVAAAAALAMVSCAKETAPATVGGTTEASVALQFQQMTNIEPEVKTYLSGQSVKWVSGDTDITVLDSKGLNCTFTWDKATGDTRKFTGKISADSEVKYVVFPTDYTASFSGTTISTTIPEMQGISNTDSFAQKVNVAVSKDGTLLKNVCGYIKFSIPTNGAYGNVGGSSNSSLSNVTKLVFETVGENEFFTGDIDIDFSGDTPVASIQTGKGNKTVTVTPKASSLSKFSATSSYYACVMPGTYSGLKITVTYIDGTTEEITTNNAFTIERSKFTTITELPLTKDPGETSYKKVVVDFSSGGSTAAADKAATGLSSLPTISLSAPRWELDADGNVIGEKIPSSTAEKENIITNTRSGDSYTFGFWATYGVGQSTGSNKVYGAALNTYKEKWTYDNKNYKVGDTDGKIWIKLPKIEGYRLLGTTVKGSCNISTKINLSSKLTDNVGDAAETGNQSMKSATLNVKLGVKNIGTKDDYYVCFPNTDKKAYSIVITSFELYYQAIPAAN